MFILKKIKDNKNESYNKDSEFMEKLTDNDRKYTKKNFF